MPLNAQKLEEPSVIAVENGLLVYAGNELPKNGYYRIERKGEKDRGFVEIAKTTSPSNLESIDKIATNIATYFKQLAPLTKVDKQRIYRYIQTNVNDDSLYRADHLPIIGITAGTAYLDTEVEKDLEYQYKVTLIKDGKPISQKELKSVRNTVFTDLPKPALYNSQIVNNAVFMEWVVPDMKDMVLFNLHRAFFGTDDFKMIAVKKGYSTSEKGVHLIAIDTTTEKSSLYKYSILPVDLYGNISEASDFVSIGKLDEEPLEPIRSLQVQPMDGHKIKLSWQLDTSIITSNIQILRSDNFDKGFVEVMNLPPGTSEFIDDLPIASENYYYYLKISGGTGQEFLSAKIAAMVKTNAEELPAPIDVDGKTIKDGIEISWRHDEPFTHGFYVYRATATEEKFNQVSNLIPANGDDPYSYKDVGEHLKAGEMYRYTIRAENDAYIMGKFSDTIHVFPGIKTKIEAPRNLKSVLRDGIVELYWEDLTETEPNLMGYKLYRKEGANGTLQLIPNDTLASYKNYFNDKEVKAGLTYDYQVTTIDYFGSESDKSNVLTVAIPSGEKTITPGAPMIFKNSDGVKLTWSQKASDTVEKIKIYRSMANNPPISIQTISAEEEYFTDTNVKKGTLYYYKISFLDQNAKESNTSQEVGIQF
jgi:fibronectin type 3 domain-containing protein